MFMKKFFSFLFVVSLLSTNLFAQKNYTTLFNKAYERYPKIPKNALEVLAHVQSRTTNLKPEVGMDHHHGPNRFGLFGLIEDGENYFKNTLLNLAAKAKVKAATLKTNEAAQIMAVAYAMNLYCLQNNIVSIEELDGFYKSFTEIPDNGNINAFAKDQHLYEIFLTLQNGSKDNDVEVKKTTINYNKWFTENTFKIVSAKTVEITDDNITSGMVEYNRNNRTSGPSALVTAAAAAPPATDYPPALWVTSPNFSGRGGTAISAVTIHTMQGTYAGSISWFQNTASQVSAHYNIRSSDGQITQMVRESNKAWHVGNANPYTVGIEHEGYVNNAAWYTTAMYNASALLTIDICNDNNINKTTCYSGAASTGINVLSTAIKIKGHQHFANQNHNDPGINWDWALYYNLINPAPPCGIAGSLTSGSVTTSAATLNWGAVTGATNYTLEYQLSTSTTYTAVAAITGTSYSLSGLQSNATYNWRVKTNCSGSSAAFSAASSFTTLAACGVTAVLNESYIGTSFVNLNWASVAGATGYIVNYKSASATTWTALTVTNNYTTINGLSASTSYNWRILTNCSAGTGVPSATQTFATQASCYDAYENNNLYTAPTLYPALNGGYVYAKICAVGDVDFYRVTTTGTFNINFTVANLPANYNIETFTNAGAFLKGGYAVGTLDEQVTLNNKPAGSYLFKIYGATTADNNALNDYRLTVTTSAPTVARIAEPIVTNDLNIVPNPAKNETILNFEMDKTEKVKIVISTMNGIVMQTSNYYLNSGLQNLKLNVQDLKAGLYTLQIITNSGLLKSKQLFITK
jgi:hypothetical protein